ncbi:MAG: hypothetical protein KIT37_08710, partial [Steroidobacteraceae bacterium]|nr:hypothetical protein [Steroidobacteraceae bacterium]
LARWPRIQKFLQQSMRERAGYGESVAGLDEVLADEGSK